MSKPVDRLHLEEALESALAAVGPVSICIDATNW